MVVMLCVSRGRAGVLCLRVARVEQTETPEMMKVRNDSSSGKKDKVQATLMSWAAAPLPLVAHPAGVVYLDRAHPPPSLPVTRLYPLSLPLSRSILCPPRPAPPPLMPWCWSGGEEGAVLHPNTWHPHVQLPGPSAGRGEERGCGRRPRVGALVTCPMCPMCRTPHLPVSCPSLKAEPVHGTVYSLVLVKSPSSQAVCVPCTSVCVGLVFVCLCLCVPGVHSRRTWCPSPRSLCQRVTTSGTWCGTVCASWMPPRADSSLQSSATTELAPGCAPCSPRCPQRRYVVSLAPLRGCIVHALVALLHARTLAPPPSLACARPCPWLSLSIASYASLLPSVPC
jgi:hypothetical protein